MVSDASAIEQESKIVQGNANTDRVSLFQPDERSGSLDSKMNFAEILTSDSDLDVVRLAGCHFEISAWGFETQQTQLS